MGCGKTIRGIVTDGLGEGKFFMSLPHYKQEIKKKIGFLAFPGTLNMKVDKDQFGLLDRKDSIFISGFEENEKKFGSVSCFKAKIGNISGAIIVPEISKHKDILEFISDKNLRVELGLKNNDGLEIVLGD